MRSAALTVASPITATGIFPFFSGDHLPGSRNLSTEMPIDLLVDEMESPARPERVIAAACAGAGV
jgi:hypothetical protein